MVMEAWDNLWKLKKADMKKGEKSVRLLWFTYMYLKLVKDNENLGQSFITDYITLPQSKSEGLYKKVNAFLSNKKNMFM